MSFYENIRSNDVISMLEKLLIGGEYILNPDDGKIWNKKDYEGKYDQPYSVPWIFTNNPPDMNCGWNLDLARALDYVRYIPTRCFNCWKVVVRPANIQQLIATYKMQLLMVKEDPKCFCKCGIELRDIVFGNYGAYFYANSMDEGLELYKKVRRHVDGHVNSDVPVILKRGCTEYEFDHGPSYQWKQPDNVEVIDKIIADHCQINDFNYKQTEIIKAKIMHSWMKFAWGIGDPSIYALTAMKRMYPELVTYHDKSKEEIKRLFEGE